jgi:hypothetical protein
MVYFGNWLFITSARTADCLDQSKCSLYSDATNTKADIKNRAGELNVNI